MTPNPKTEEKNPADPPEEVDAGLAATGEYPHADSKEANPVQKGSTNRAAAARPARNPKDHGIDGAE